MPEGRPTEEQLAKFELCRQAIDDHKTGKPPTVRCPECDELLEVTHIEVISTIWVTCPRGCLSFHVS